jgi:hypothetical protein
MYATHDIWEKASGDALGHEPLAKPRLLSMVSQALSGPWTVMEHSWCGYGEVMVRVERLYNLFSCSGDVEHRLLETQETMERCLQHVSRRQSVLSPRG